MSALEDAKYAADAFRAYGSTDGESAAKSQIVIGRAHIAQAEEQRITNLIALLPHVDRQSRDNILDELAEMIGIELVQGA